MAIVEKKQQKRQIEAPIKARGKELLDHWFLDRNITYLNHGAFGALTKEVFAGADEWRVKMETQPSLFIREKLRNTLRKSATYLGRYVGARGRDLVFVDNASTALNAVLRSLVLLPGDEIVTTNHVHWSALRTLEFICERAGARIQFARIPYPVEGDEDVTDSIIRMMSPRTRLVLMDHITSPTAITLPVEQVCAEARDRGIPVLIDGAHAPGSLNLKIEEIGCDWYIGNCHKWLGAPRGCAFLWTREEHQNRVRPTTISETISWGYTAAFDWPGTKDFAPYLAVFDAIKFRRRFGEDEIESYCHNLILEGAKHIAAIWGTERGVPDSMTRFMTTIRWPGPEKATVENMDILRRLLRENYQIEAEVKSFDNKIWVRICAYLYNELDDYKALAKAGLEIHSKNLIANN